MASFLVGAAACGGSSATSVPVCEAAPGLDIGESIQGTLVDGDDTFDGAYIDYYRIRLSPSQQITITHSSSDFDPLLLVFDASGTVAAQDFDRDGRPPGELETAALTRAFGVGCFLVGASVWDRGDTGAYTLSVVDNDAG